MFAVFLHSSTNMLIQLVYYQCLLFVENDPRAEANMNTTCLFNEHKPSQPYSITSSISFTSYVSVAPVSLQDEVNPLTQVSFLRTMSDSLRRRSIGQSSSASVKTTRTIVLAPPQETSPS